MSSDLLSNLANLEGSEGHSGNVATLVCHCKKLLRSVMLLPNLAIHCTNLRTQMLEHKAGQ